MIKPLSFSFYQSAAALLLMLFAVAACDCLPCMSDDTSPVTSPAYATSFVQLAPLAPPPAQAEEKPENNSPRTMIWRPGYWDYSGGDFHWVSGEMMDKPSPTAVWSPDHWIEHTYGWAFVPGYWQ